MSPKTFFQRTHKRVVNSTHYSLEGLRHLMRNEEAARYETGAFVLSLVIYLIIGAPAYVYIIGLFLFFFLIGMEALNTAIEVIIDKISPEISEVGKSAKDLGSLAVFCLVLCNLIFFGLILWLHFSGKLIG